jgi:hypothetical protein
VRVRFAGAFFFLALAGRAQAKAPSSRPAPVAATAQPPVANRAAPPLPMLPSVARVCVEAGRDRVVIIEDVNLPRGDWQSGGLDLYVAFGAPGTPIAMDARLISPVRAETGHGEVEANGEEAEERIATETAAERGPGIQPLLGPPQMAGLVLHIKETQLRHAYAAADRVVVRVRSLLRAPSADATGARDVVVRLGVATGLAMTLGRIQVVSLEPPPWITQAEAILCGPEANRQAMTVTLMPRPPARPDDTRDHTIPPPAAVRHPSDDMCIRWWTREPDD